MKRKKQSLTIRKTVPERVALALSTKDPAHPPMNESTNEQPSAHGSCPLGKTNRSAWLKPCCRLASSKARKHSASLSAWQAIHQRPPRRRSQPHQAASVVGVGLVWSVGPTVQPPSPGLRFGVVGRMVGWCWCAPYYVGVRAPNQPRIYHGWSIGAWVGPPAHQNTNLMPTMIPVAESPSPACGLDRIGPCRRSRQQTRRRRASLRRLTLRSA